MDSGHTILAPALNTKIGTLFYRVPIYVILKKRVYFLKEGILSKLCVTFHKKVYFPKNGILSNRWVIFPKCGMLS